MASTRVTTSAGQYRLGPHPWVIPISAIAWMSGSWTEPSSSVKIPEIELTYAFADATDLGNGWFEISVPFSDFVGTEPNPTTFGILSGYGLGEIFYITDVKLTVDQ